MVRFLLTLTVPHHWSKSDYVINAEFIYRYETAARGASQNVAWHGWANRVRGKPLEPPFLGVSVKNDRIDSKPGLGLYHTAEIQS